MNNFTKDELSTIDYLIDSYCVHSWVPEGAYGALKTKIQSMIDNYCAHESDEHCYYPDGIKCTDFLTYACSESPCFLKCKKCKELYK